MRSHPPAAPIHQTPSEDVRSPDTETLVPSAHPAPLIGPSMSAARPARQAERGRQEPALPGEHETSAANLAADNPVKPPGSPDRESHRNGGPEFSIEIPETPELEMPQTAPAIQAERGPGRPVAVESDVARTRITAPGVLAQSAPQRQTGDPVPQSSAKSERSEPTTVEAEGDPVRGPDQARITPDRLQPVDPIGDPGTEQRPDPSPRQQPPLEAGQRPAQGAVRTEPVMLARPAPQQPVQQPQTAEIPQVRIGQINVLVEDQASAKPTPRKRASRPAATNPFGLRGL